MKNLVFTLCWRAAHALALKLAPAAPGGFAASALVRWLGWLGWLALLPFVTAFGPPRLVDQIYTPTQRVQVGEVEEWLAQQTPELSASAYLLYDVDADRLLVTHNIEEALPPASLTKLMTALLVLEANDLQAEVTIEVNDLVGDSSMGLRVGEKVTVEALLWGLLLPSGNDAAAALARHTAGSVAEFVAQMNQRATVLGLRQTHFRNPHGLDAGGHTSSAADLLTLTLADWRFPLFRQIVSQATATVAGHTLRNTNELLGQYPGANGVKTGTTDAAGQCLVASIQPNDHQVIAIVLGSTDRYQDVRALYAYYQAAYGWIDKTSADFTALNRLHVAPPDDESGGVAVGADGADEEQTWYLRATGAAPALLVPKRDRQRLRFFRRLHLPPPSQPWVANLEVGELEWRLGDLLLGVQPLVLW
ncbi:MAG: D-alanyl-D-alanine carboxypeptidase family protein [Caldilineaceae bacterium]